MRFSLITVALNAEKTLEETLASAMQQDFNDFEHILWDGGSKDQTLAIAAKFPHVKVIQGSDKGIADAMNKATSHAKGDFILHLHADDLLAHPQVLSMAEATLRLHPHLEWFYGMVSIIDEKSQKVRTTDYVPFSVKKLRRYNIIPHPATFIKRSLFTSSGGFDPTLRYCMDYDLWIRLAALSTPFALPTLFTYFREHPNSLSTRETLGVADEAHQVRLKHTRNPLAIWRSYRTWKRRRRALSK